MNMEPEYNTEAIQSEAERWFVRLRADDCTVQQRRDFDAWIAADTAHARAYDQIQHLWSELDGLAKDAEVAKWRREARCTADAASVRPKRWRWGLAAAASLAVVMFFAGGFAWWWSSNTFTGRYETARGKQRSVSLTDGSKVVLNTATVLHVHLDPRERRVQLREGEAVFDVAHQADRPFIVHAGGNTITDIGTRFDVHRDGARTVITVIKGNVDVARGGRSAELTLGEQLAAGDGIWRKRHVNVASATGWTQGKLIFHATALSKVVAESNRYGPGYLIIADPSLDSIKVSGQLRIGNTRGLVRALQIIFPIRVEHIPFSDRICLYRQKSK